MTTVDEHRVRPTADEAQANLQTLLGCAQRASCAGARRPVDQRLFRRVWQAGGGSASEKRILLVDHTRRTSSAAYLWHKGKPGGETEKNGGRDWLVVTCTKARNQGVTSAKVPRPTRADDYHLHDPRLARLVCEGIAETSGLDAAAVEVGRALAERTSDPAWDDLALWLTWRQHTAARAARIAASRVITYVRRARPDGRANPNPYLP